MRYVIIRPRYCGRGFSEYDNIKNNREAIIEPLNEVKESEGTQQAKPAAAGEVHTDGSLNKSLNIRKLRVNIFDDDVSNLKMLKSYLFRKDYEILTFDRPLVCPGNGAKSEKFSISNACADVMITDYQMPEMTGIEMLLQQVQRECKIDIRNKIVMSADLDAKGQKTLDGLGCTFFRKPFKLNELSACLDGCEKRIDLSKPLGI